MTKKYYLSVTNDDYTKRQTVDDLLALADAVREIILAEVGVSFDNWRFDIRVIKGEENDEQA